MGIFATLAALAGRCLLPQTCAHCRQDLAARWPQSLCPDCSRGLAACEPPYCLRCCEPMSAGRLLCRSCAGRPFACRLIRAAFFYRGPMPALIHGFKYRGRKDAARAAGRWMARHLCRFPELAGAEALVAVPLHWRKLRQRGYNQAEILAEALGAEAGLPVLNLLKRTVSTRPQWDLDRDSRLLNLSGAFAARPQARNRRLLLIDDVCTSGTSLEECGRALRRAGAAEVNAFVLARQTLFAGAPPPGK